MLIAHDVLRLHITVFRRSGVKAISIESKSSRGNKSYRLLSDIDNNLVLVPLAGNTGGAPSLLRFCRTLWSKAAILAPNEAFLNRPSVPDSPGVSATAADALADILRAARKAHDLGLMPTILIGHGRGAAIAANFVLKYGSLLAGAILLRPTVLHKIMNGGDVEDLPILLCRVASETMRGTAGWQLEHTLRAAGTRVICETVSGRRSPGGRESGLARVFLASYFDD